MRHILIVLVSTILLVNGLPSSNKKTSKKFDDSRTDKLTSLPKGAKLPASSTFLDKTEKVDGARVFGQYSYVDPLGSLVVVKYNVGKDGTDYTEKRLLTVNYKSESKIDVVPIPDEKVSVRQVINGLDYNEDIHNGSNEDELIEKIIEKLLPKIKEIVAKEKNGDNSGILTPASLSVFDYFYSKVNKIEGILSQMMCEMLSSNAGQKTQKTEDELISGIIFKVVALLPEGTLLDYAKKLSRHVRQAENADEVTTTVSPSEETTISTSNTNDTTPFGTLFSNLFLQFFTNDNSTSSDSFGDTENSEGLLMDILNMLFADETANENEGTGINSFLKQIISHGQEGFMGQVAELLLDVEALFSLYTREAMCLNVPGQGLNKPAEKPVETEDEQTTTEPPNEEKDEEEVATEATTESAPEAKIDVQEFKPLVESLVQKLVTSSVSSSPMEDEEIISKVVGEIEPKINERLRRRHENLSDEILTEDAKSDAKSMTLVAIHEQRKKIFKNLHEDWPTKSA